MYKTGVPNDPKFHKTVVKQSKWQFLENSLKEYDKKISILDLGCSGGGKLLYLYSKGYSNIQGIEYASNVFKTSWNQIPHIKIKQGNAEDLRRFKSEQFNLIYACHLLEHLPNPEKCVKEASRVLKKKGKFVIGIPNGYHLSDIIMRFIQKLIYGQTDHIQSFDLKKISKLLNSYNFKITKTAIDWGSLDFLLDVRMNRVMFYFPKKILYPIFKKIYWKEIGFNIVAVKD